MSTAVGHNGKIDLHAYRNTQTQKHQVLWTNTERCFYLGNIWLSIFLREEVGQDGLLV